MQASSQMTKSEITWVPPASMPPKHRKTKPPTKILLTNGIMLQSHESFEDAADYLVEGAGRPRICHYIYWASFVRSQHNKEYLDALTSADIILPDGIGLLSYIRIIYGKSILNLNGTDLNPVVLAKCSALNMPIALYGTNQISIKRCVNNLNSRGIEVYYNCDGYSEFDFSRVRKGSVLMVGLGTPHQEIWTFQNRSKIRDLNLTIITVGGYFDFESGEYTRAPRIVRYFKFEWLYRLIQNPVRHYSKYAKNLLFPYVTLRDYFIVHGYRSKINAV
jgi:exopolysaccharide biosynthesis WecB/TagA/CpsF family protein